MDEEELKAFIAAQQDMPAEFQQIVNDNFWEMLDDNAEETDPSY